MYRVIRCLLLFLCYNWVGDIMASSIIHMAVAKKVNEVLKLDNEKHFLFGSIVPDVAKMVGLRRSVSHFISSSDNTSIPGAEKFYLKYKEYLNNAYELGYYVHLLTDVLWFKEFMPNFAQETYLISQTGEKLKFDERELKEIIYNDYTNLNSDVLAYYNFDLSLFYEEFDFPCNHIEEVPSKYFPDVIDKLGAIAQNINNGVYILKIERIIHFIEYATIYCLDELKKKGLI